MGLFFNINISWYIALSKAVKINGIKDLSHSKVNWVIVLWFIAPSQDEKWPFRYVPSWEYNQWLQFNIFTHTVKYSAAKCFDGKGTAFIIL